MGNIGQTILTVVGVIVGAVIGYIVGGPMGAIKGAMWGAMIGGGLGSVLFPSATKKPRPQELQFQSSVYGTTIPVLYGTRKLSGNCLWYANFHAWEQYQEAGKGGDKQMTGYIYTVSLAFGLCMNTAGDRGMSVTRIWSGKDELNLAWLLMMDQIRIYDGTQTGPDSHMAAFLERAPTYKGLCWVVFPNYQLGNSPYIPNFTFEVGGILDIDPSLCYLSQFSCIGECANDPGDTPYPPPEPIMEPIVIVGRSIDETSYRVTRVDPSDYETTIWTRVIDRPQYAEGPMMTVDTNPELVKIGWMADPCFHYLLNVSDGTVAFKSADLHPDVGNWQEYVIDSLGRLYWHRYKGSWPSGTYEIGLVNDDGSTTDQGANLVIDNYEQMDPFSGYMDYICPPSWFYAEGQYPDRYIPKYGTPSGNIHYENDSPSDYETYSVEQQSVYLPAELPSNWNNELRVIFLGDPNDGNMCLFWHRVVNNRQFLIVMDCTIL